jgi:hypothetical protein
MMIKRTIIVAILLFITYSIFVISFAPRWWNASQHQWQDNVIKAQKFIYNDKDAYNNVIVGSSLSCRLVIDSIPQTYNLSFGGQSIFDGLKILTHVEKLPKIVFVEMNEVLRAEDKKFTSSLFSSMLYYPKKKLLSLREDKQPLGIIGAKISYRLIGLSIIHLKSFFHLSQDSMSNNNGTDLFSKLLQLQFEGYSKLPSQLLIDESFNNLKKYVAELEKKDINVVFFELPINSKLVNTPRANIIRKTFYDYFPKKEYNYIPLPDSTQYITTDGIHLGGNEALQYTLFFKTKINLMCCDLQE